MHDFTRLKQAILDPADGPYAVTRMRELLIAALKHLPEDCYRTADLLLPLGKSISQRARLVIDYIIEILEADSAKHKDIYNLAYAYRFIC